MISNIICFSPSNESLYIPIVAFNIKQISPRKIAMILDSLYNRAVRAGLHCNPFAHKMLSTEEQGVVRVSLSVFNTEEEVNILYMQ